MAPGVWVMRLLSVATASLVMSAGLATAGLVGHAQAASAQATTAQATIARAMTSCARSARQQLGGGCGAVAFGHRGAYSDSIDENTTKALEAAYDEKAYMESDVWLTQDHALLIMHDSSLDRTTDCEGEVSEWSMADIREQCRTTPNGQIIPTFNRFVKALSHNPGQRMMVDVKGDGWYDDDNAALKRLRDAASAAGVLNRVFFADDAGTGIIEALRDDVPDARTAWKQADGEEVTRKRAKELSVDAVVARPREWTSRDMVHSFQSDGFFAWSLLVNDEPAWRALIRRGVTGVLTDDPEGFRKVCAKMGS